MAAQLISADERQRMIAEAAYFRAERRGFTGGDPLVDWVEAEAEVEARLRDIERTNLLESLDERLAKANGRLHALKKGHAGTRMSGGSEKQRVVETLAQLCDSLENGLAEIRRQGAQAGEKALQQAEKIGNEISALLRWRNSRTGGRRRAESSTRMQDSQDASIS